MSELLSNILTRIRAMETPLNRFSEILRVQTDRLEIHRVSLEIVNDVNRSIVDALRVVAQSVNAGPTVSDEPNPNVSASENSTP